MLGLALLATALAGAPAVTAAAEVGAARGPAWGEMPLQNAALGLRSVVHLDDRVGVELSSIGWTQAQPLTRTLSRGTLLMRAGVDPAELPDVVVPLYSLGLGLTATALKTTLPAGNAPITLELQGAAGAHLMWVRWWRLASVLTPLSLYDSVTARRPGWWLGADLVAHRGPLHLGLTLRDQPWSDAASPRHTVRVGAVVGTRLGKAQPDSPD